MKRTIIVFTLTLLLSLAACSLGLVTARRAERLEALARQMEDVPTAEALSELAQGWRASRALFSCLARNEWVSQGDAALAACEDALERGEAPREALAQLCSALREIQRLGWPEAGDLF